MSTSPNAIERLSELRQLLGRRLELIADKNLRECNPGEQLRLLAEVSNQISQWHMAHRGMLPPRLNHFLSQASFGKALDWIDMAITDHSLIESSESDAA